VCAYLDGYSGYNAAYGATAWFPDYEICLADYLECFDTFCIPGVAFDTSNYQNLADSATIYLKCICKIDALRAAMGSAGATVCAQAG
jgi:hypothetical protein